MNKLTLKINRVRLSTSVRAGQKTVGCSSPAPVTNPAPAAQLTGQAAAPASADPISFGGGNPESCL